MSVIQQISLNTFSKHSVVYLQVCFSGIIFSCGTESLRMPPPLALLMDGINLILTSGVLALKVYFVMLH